MDFYRKNIIYSADRYEIWEAGKCLDSGMCAATIKSIASDNKIKFVIEGIEGLPLSPVATFFYQDSSAEILHDRIQYFDLNNSGRIPSVCNFFPTDDGEDIAYIRFAVAGNIGYKIIEFYGHVTRIGGVIDDPTLAVTSASKIIGQLKQSRSYSSNSLLQWAVDIFNANSDFTSLDSDGFIRRTDAIVESLKLFVEALKCDMQDEQGPSLMYPKYCMFIASCNYKIGNYNQAYHVANKGLESMDDVMEHSVFTGFDRDFLGQKELQEIVDAIEDKHFDEIDWSLDSMDIDETEVDTSRYEELKRRLTRYPDTKRNNSAVPQKPSKNDIRELIEILDSLARNNPSDGLESWQFSQVMEVFKNPLLMAWQKCEYGWHSDFWEEGHSMIDYMMFEMKAKEVVTELIRSLREQSLFAPLEQGRPAFITEGLINVYTYLLSQLEG